MEKWPFYLGTITILSGATWTTLSGELGTGLILSVWGAALIIKDAVNDAKVV